MEKQPHSYKTKPRSRSQRREAGQYIRSLQQTTPEEWVKRINSVSKKIRSEVAKVIWWDFFGGKECTKAWRHLDEYMYAPYIELQRETLINALIKCGYSKTHATKRIGHTWKKKNANNQINVQS